MRDHLTMDAIILAGSSKKEKHDFGMRKSQIRYNGKTLLSIVVDALSGSAFIDRVFLIGSLDEMNDIQSAVEAVTQPDRHVIANISRCITDNGIHGNFLTVASDLPFISTNAVEDFILISQKSNAKMFYPVVPKKAFCNQYKDYRKTFFRLKEGDFTSGSIFIADAEATVRMVEFAQSYFDNRKLPFKLAGLISLKGIVKFLSGRLSMSEVVETVKKRTGYDIEVVISSYPQIALDIDKPYQISKLNGI